MNAIRCAVLAVAMFSGACMMLPPVQSQAQATDCYGKVPESQAEQQILALRAQQNPQQASPQDQIQATMGTVFVHVVDAFLSRM